MLENKKKIKKFPQLTTNTDNNERQKGDESSSSFSVFTFLFFWRKKAENMHTDVGRSSSSCKFYKGRP